MKEPPSTAAAGGAAAVAAAAAAVAAAAAAESAPHSHDAVHCSNHAVDKDASFNAVRVAETMDAEPATGGIPARQCGGASSRYSVPAFTAS